jgi:hypothetical protein
MVARCRCRPKAAGLDAGVKATSICGVDSTGSAVLETSVATEPEAIRCALEGYADRLRRVGHEAARCRRGCIAGLSGWA